MVIIKAKLLFTDTDSLTYVINLSRGCVKRLLG